MDINLSPAAPPPGGIVPFHFDGAQVRVITRDGEPWFVLADVCKVLEIGNTADAARRLDEDEKDGVDIIDAIGRPQKATIINESGLYSLILTSRKPEAKRFKKWVTGEVLPSIRKTGSYQAERPRAALSREELFARAVLESQAVIREKDERINHLETRNTALEEDSESLDRIARADGAMNLMTTAKVLQLQPKRFIGFMESNAFIYRRATGKSHLAYQSRIQQGYLEHKVSTAILPDGSERIQQQVFVTAKGLVHLAKVLNVDLGGPSRLV